MPSVDNAASGRTTSSVEEANDPIRERLARLERRIDVLLDLEHRAMDETSARCIQSVGLVVDYLATRGLVDRDDLARHIERDFEITDVDHPNGPSIPAVDIYGWLRWSATIRDLRERGRPPWAELSDPAWSWLRGGTGNVEPDVEVETERVVKFDPEASQRRTAGGGTRPRGLDEDPMALPQFRGPAPL